MAFRALISKLRVLPERTAASRAFASQREKRCPKCSREVQPRYFTEMMDDSKRRHMEEMARLKRRNTVAYVVGTASVSALLFYAICVVEAVFDDDL